MIALTQEKREEKIKRLNKIASWADSYGADHNVMIPAVEAKEMAEAYIASLTVEPAYYVFKHPNGKLFHSLVDESCKGHNDVYPVFTAPPVPEIKRSDLLDIPDDLDLASAMAAINWYEMEIKRLNGITGGA